MPPTRSSSRSLAEALVSWSSEPRLRSPPGSATPPPRTRSRSSSATSTPKTYFAPERTPSMPAPHPDVIAWIDVETTGLDPAREHLLEISLILTDTELNPVADPASVLIDPTVEDVPPDCKAGSDLARTASACTRDMHASIGLFAEQDAGLGVTPGEADGLIA